MLCDALGLPGDGAAGDRCRVTVDETGPVDGIVYFANANTIGVRTAGAFYRFLRGFGHPVVAAHQLFSADADPDHALSAWESWLARVLNPNPPLEHRLETK